MIPCGTHVSDPSAPSLSIRQNQKSCVYFVLQGLRFVSIMFLDGLCVILGTVRGKELARTVRMGTCVSTMFLDGLCVLLGTVRGKELARTVRMGGSRRQYVPSGLLLHATASVWRWFGLVCVLAILLICGDGLASVACCRPRAWLPWWWQRLSLGCLSAPCVAGIWPGTCACRPPLLWQRIGQDLLL